MRMGFRTAYDQPTQYEYYPNRFGAYGAVMFNPYGGTEDDKKGTLSTAIDLYKQGLKDGDLEAYALPVGALVASMPMLLNKNKIVKKNKKVLHMVGVASMLYSVGMTLYTAYGIANPSV